MHTVGTVDPAGLSINDVSSSYQKNLFQTWIITVSKYWRAPNTGHGHYEEKRVATACANWEWEVALHNYTSKERFAVGSEFTPAQGSSEFLDIAFRSTYRTTVLDANVTAKLRSVTHATVKESESVERGGRANSVINPYAKTAVSTDAVWSRADVNVITGSLDQIARSVVVVRPAAMANVVTISRSPALVSPVGVVSSAREILSIVLDMIRVKMEESARMEVSKVISPAVVLKVTSVQRVRSLCLASVSIMGFAAMVDSVQLPTRSWVDVNVPKVSREDIAKKGKLSSMKHVPPPVATMASILLLATCVVVFFLKYKRMRRLIKDPITQNAINEHRQIHELPKRLKDCQSPSDEAYKVFVIPSKKCKDLDDIDYEKGYISPPRGRYRTLPCIDVVAVSSVAVACTKTVTEPDDPYTEIEFRPTTVALEDKKLADNACVV
ncbi:unnamed protein product [Haemonchus placei]|uniref:F5/8 type C domain-containing protein n=1 Tax=Haemonchus placei TaxID=6290 RepID=A0A0N4WM90_HAEPC|nr:unnamed protein product [Haemonchus placei]